jgi:hypothetical protein
MYDINTKNVKKGRGFYFLFLLAGLIFLGIIGSVLISSYTKLSSLNSKTKSTKVIVKSHIDDGTILYSPTYYFNVDGREYFCNSDSSSSANPGTSNKMVYYDSNNPTICMTDYSKSNNNFFLLFIILPLAFITLAIVNMIKINKRLKLIKELNKTGKLVKNLPYHLENTGMAVNGVQIQRPVVEYPLSSGSTITLRGDPRHDKKSSDADGLVDVVIDENNTDNYFIDFEINRLTGNLATDYYDNIQNNQEPDTQLNNEQNVQPQVLPNNIINSEQTQPVVQQSQTNPGNNVPNNNQ